jgi:hypothetical protein
MRALRSLGGFAVGSAFLAFAFTGAQAATVSIVGGAPLAFPPTYGTASSDNNVINSGLPINSVTDGFAGATFVGSNVGGGGTMAVVQSTIPNYNVDWYFIGAESGFSNTFFAPQINGGTGSFTEANQNNNCATCGASANTGPIALGLSTGQTSTNVNFAMGVGAPVAINGVNNPDPFVANNSMVFSYVEPGNLNGPVSTWTWRLVGFATDWFLAGFNDTGGPDDNHDDIMIIGHIVDTNVPGEIPIPGAFVLMGTVLAGAGAFAKWRRRREQQVAA